MMIVPIWCYSQDTLKITSEQLRITNLIFLEHKKFSEQVPLLENKIYNLEQINKSWENTDSIRKSQLLYYDQEKRYKYLTKGAKKTYLQMALYFALAVVQGLATGVILKTALHFEVTSLGLYYFTCVSLYNCFFNIS